MSTITVMFSHFPLEHTNVLYDWHKDKVSNLKIIWNVDKIEPEEITENKNPNILPMKLPMLNGKNFTQIIPSCLTWFQQEKWDHIIVMESDSVILYKEFEEKCINYMNKHQISVMLPWIRSDKLNPKHPFSNGLQLMQTKYWAIPAITIMTRLALDYYGFASANAPQYWHEIRFPSVLMQGNFFTSFNPFLDDGSFHAPAERNTKSLTKEEIEEGIVKNNVMALHPIKETELLSFVEELTKDKK